MARIRKLTLPCISALTAQLKSLKDEPGQKGHRSLKDQGTANRDVAILGLGRCPQWVISGHTDKSAPCPLYPQ